MTWFVVGAFIGTAVVLLIHWLGEKSKRSSIYAYRQLERELEAARRQREAVEKVVWLRDEIHTTRELSEAVERAERGETDTELA